MQFPVKLMNLHSVVTKGTRAFVSSLERGSASSDTMQFDGRF